MIILYLSIVRLINQVKDNFFIQFNRANQGGKYFLMKRWNSVLKTVRLFISVKILFSYFY